MGTVEVSSVMRTALGVPIELANDVQVGVMAESRLGAGRPYDSMLGVCFVAPALAVVL